MIAVCDGWWLQEQNREGPRRYDAVEKRPQGKGRLPGILSVNKLKDKGPFQGGVVGGWGVVATVGVSRWDCRKPEPRTRGVVAVFCGATLWLRAGPKTNGPEVTWFYELNSVFPCCPFVVFAKQ